MTDNDAPPADATAGGAPGGGAERPSNDTLAALPTRVRVHALARLVGSSSREVLGVLARLDVGARSAQSSVDRDTVARVVDEYFPAAPTPAADVVPAADASGPGSDDGSGAGTAESTAEEQGSSSTSSGAAPMFLAPGSEDAPSRPRRRRAARTATVSPGDDSGETEAAEPAAGAAGSDSSEAESDSDDTGSDSDTDTGEDGDASRRRRRRGRRGRGRGRGGPEDADESDEDTTSEAGSGETDGSDGDSGGETPKSGGRRSRGGGKKSVSGAGDSADAGTPDTGGKGSGGQDPGSQDSGDQDSGDGDSDEGKDESESSAGSRRRRRRRRRGGDSDGDSSGEGGDPPNTVTHVREKAEKSGKSGSGKDSGKDEVRGVKGSTRLEAKRQRRRDGRDAGRRRPAILSESEFLARRESVERTMVVRDQADRTQIGVLEDDVLVEHFVAGRGQTSMVGNVYLGRVQNVLPSMEAAFVDIGRGRNAVLYAGEVNWDASGLEGKQRKIEQALSSGDSVLVQVTKDPVGHKGARLTTQVSLPGRFLVYVPGGGATGISRKLPDAERKRLKEILKRIVPDEAGVIIRTAAEGAAEDELERDVRRLQAQWETIREQGESSGKGSGKGGGSKKASGPTLVHEEPDLLVRVVRDMFNGDFSSLVVSGEQAWETVENYVSSVAPELVPRLSRHTGPEDVFTAHRIDEQLIKALDRKVWLPSGGTLVIDRTEAMTVVDVNTGKFTGSGGNLEETVTRNNLEAAEEIVRQLRLRDVGGMIVIDFIDMVLESNRDLVLRRLTECLGRDRTRHQVSEVTSLGLVQMTRKRVGQGLLDEFSTPCEHCKGRGVVVHSEPVIESGSGRGRGANGSGGSGRGSGQDGAGKNDSGRNGSGQSDTDKGSGKLSGPAQVAAQIGVAAGGGAKTGGDESADEQAPTTAPEADGPGDTAGESGGGRRRGRRGRRAASAPAGSPGSDGDAAATDTSSPTETPSPTDTPSADAPSADPAAPATSAGDESGPDTTSVTSAATPTPDSGNGDSGNGDSGSGATEAGDTQGGETQGGETQDGDTGTTPSSGRRRRRSSSRPAGPPVGGGGAAPVAAAVGGS